MYPGGLPLRQPFKHFPPKAAKNVLRQFISAKEPQNIISINIHVTYLHDCQHHKKEECRFYIHHRSLTWPLKNGGWRTTFLLGRELFRGYLNFGGVWWLSHGFEKQMPGKNGGWIIFSQFTGWTLKICLKPSPVDFMQAKLCGRFFSHTMLEKKVCRNHTTVAVGFPASRWM